MNTDVAIENDFLSLEIADGVGILWMDLKGEEWNKVTLSMVGDFEGILEAIETDPTIKAVVLISKKKGFMAGADIEEFLKMGPGEAKSTAVVGHKLFARIEDCAKPFVSAIHGACMGGGTEISLACAARIATSHSSTVLGLPEVKLGLLPGLGGTYRLPRLIGLQKALDMMLTGKNIYAQRAYKMGLVDRLVDQPKQLEAAKKFALEIAGGNFKRKDKRTTTEKLLEATSVTRNIIFDKARQMVMRSTYGNYPAPLQILASVKDGYGKPREKAWEQESTKFDGLMQTPESKQLINIFFGMNALKKNPMKDQVKPVKTLGMLGAGLMGEGIAEVSVNNGMEVLLKDINLDMLTQAKKNIWKAFSKKVKYKTIPGAEAERLIGNVHTGLDFTGYDKADMVIEAVFEDLDLKHKVLQETEAAIGEQCVFASNTSALPISAIANKAKRPENVIGMHYFSPVQKMPLLEIVVTEKTADWVTATALEVGIRQGKTCIVVKDGPGFYTTRILAPYMNEALLLLEEGADILQLDKAMKKFGFPVGPITLMDEVGIDVGAHINRGELRTFFDQRGAESSNAMEALEEAGYKGRKNKKGFLLYDDKTGKKVRGKANEEIYEHFGGSKRKNFSDEEIQDRMSLIMINEAALCLQEKIIKEARDGDIGAVFGLGFPPFRGGPFRYVDAVGAQEIVNKMNELLTKGKRFTPAPILDEYAKTNKKFYNQGAPGPTN